MEINFTKMHGCGNDFIVIDHRDNHLDELDLEACIEKVCRRKYGVGANGLMLLEDSGVADFKMRYFNADGSTGEMCGNGARCIAKFAYMKGVTQRDMVFETLDGIYTATIQIDGNVMIYFPDIAEETFNLHHMMTLGKEEVEYHYGVVGVPHTVLFTENMAGRSAEEFESWGRKIRYQPVFPAGTNVNHVEVTSPGKIQVRTYERGVEEETLACGSGACAAAVFTALLHKGEAPFDVQTMGGILNVDFTRISGVVTNITLTGDAVRVYDGRFYT